MARRAMICSYCLFYVLAVLAVAFSWNAAPVSAEPGLYGGTWRAVEIGGSAVAGKAPLTLGIEPNGNVSGSGGCNRFTGTVTIDGNAMTFPPFAATRKMCVPEVMDPEQEFLGALAAVASYRLDGPHLILDDAYGQQRVKLIRSK
jgi:putative lipoprotein